MSEWTHRIPARPGHYWVRPWDSHEDERCFVFYFDGEDWYRAGGEDITCLDLQGEHFLERYASVWPERIEPPSAT